MVESSTLLSLSQLVDLSLNCQEGVVHFQALHVLLHVMVQQAAINEVTVEFRGNDSVRMQGIISGTKPTAKGQFTEYTVTGGQKKRRNSKRTVSLQDVKDKVAKSEKETAKERELRVIERRKDSKEDPDLHPPPLNSPTPSACDDRSLQTFVLFDSHTTLPQFSVAISKEMMDSFQDELLRLRTEVKELHDMPGNMGLITATKENSPIPDMFQMLTVTKRVEANEEGVSKLSSLVADLVKMMPAGAIDAAVAAEFAKPADDGAAPKVDVSGLEHRLDKLEKAIDDLTAGGGVVVRAPADAAAPPTGGEEDARRLSDDLELSGKKTGSWTGAYPSCLDGVNLDELPPAEAFRLIQREFELLRKWIDTGLKEMILSLTEGQEGGGISGDCLKKIEELDTLYNQQICLLNEQVGNLQRDLEALVTKLDQTLPGGDSTGVNEETTMELTNKLKLLEQEIIAVAEHADQLQADKVERDKNISFLVEQIDVLKIVKANREDLEDALGDKADACQINRKVSHDQFDAACDDLSKGIEEALGKLQEQEDMWRHALDAIQRDVGNKLDKNEVDPLRDFVNSKLRALQEKFKSLVSLKKENEAAGTKSKLLKDVNCLSCDKDVVMRREMDATMKPKPYGMPQPRNMAPYLAYELDQLRKQQKCVPGSKNLNFLESALKTKTSKEKDHLCNRYCGGSHTVTTPQQRVSRLGHFLEQWGPEIAPLHEEYIRGKDGQMYKARDETSYKKSSKSDVAASEAMKRSSKDDAQLHRPTIDPEAEKMLTKEAERKSLDVERKSYAIGSAVQDQAKGAADASKTSVGGEPRASVAGEPRASVAGEPRASVAGEPRASVAGEPRTSVSGEPRTSVAGEPRTSVAGEPGTSVSEEPKTSVTRVGSVQARGSTGSGQAKGSASGQQVATSPEGEIPAKTSGGSVEAPAES